jgi:hypothetical protein
MRVVSNRGVFVPRKKKRKTKGAASLVEKRGKGKECRVIIQKIEAYSRLLFMMKHSGVI